MRSVERKPIQRGSVEVAYKDKNNSNDGHNGHDDDEDEQFEMLLKTKLLTVRMQRVYQAFRGTFKARAMSVPSGEDATLDRDRDNRDRDNRDRDNRDNRDNRDTARALSLLDRYRSGLARVFLFVAGAARSVHKSAQRDPCVATLS